MHASSGIQVISRAAQILRLFKGRHTGLSLGRIASGTGLPRSTVQRIVNALIGEGFIATGGQDGDLRLGPEILALAASSRLNIARLLRPALERLAETTGETVDLAVFKHDRMTFIDQVPGRHRLRTVSNPGEDFPLWTTANGKACLALLSDEAIATAHRETHSDRALAEVMAELATVRKTGLAYDLDMHTPGISAAGIAFRAPDACIYAVSVPTPSARFAARRNAIERALVDLLATKAAM